MDDRTGDPGRGTEQRPLGDDGAVWGTIGTLVAGPLLWGGVGYGLDSVLGRSGLFTAGGVLVGFGVAMYIVYVRYVRD